MHAALFENSAEWDTTEEAARSTMNSYAAELGLDPAKFVSCMAPGSPARLNVESNIAEGRRLGLNGTPAFVVNGKLLSGAQPLDVFQRVIDRELQSVGAEKGDEG